MKNKRINLFFKIDRKNYQWRWKHDNMITHHIRMKWKFVKTFWIKFTLIKWKI